MGREESVAWAGTLRAVKIKSNRAGRFRIVSRVSYLSVAPSKRIPLHVAFPRVDVSIAAPR